ncbi:MAG: hypothetical protein BGO78_08890 [Chloroflexi bacterium 44-23]|mgnify:FL=1|nr:MAG: hypothetical protein BGO78_08890 [Chloroflexi bacterium 44-23]
MDYRQQLIRTGCQLFAKRGYDAVAVQDIVSTVGITKPTLYHYFGSKQGLLEAILATYLQPFTSALEGQCQYQNDLVLSLEKICRYYFEFVRLEPGFFRLWMSIRLAPPQSTAYLALATYMFRQQEMIKAMFVQAGRQHGNLRDRHEMLMLSFTGMIYMYATQAIQTGTNLENNLVYQLVHQFMHGILS